MSTALTRGVADQMVEQKVGTVAALGFLELEERFGNVGNSIPAVFNFSLTVTQEHRVLVGF